jgi:hypothetical protein
LNEKTMAKANPVCRSRRRHRLHEPGNNSLLPLGKVAILPPGVKLTTGPGARLAPVSGNSCERTKRQVRSRNLAQNVLQYPLSYKFQRHLPDTLEGGQHDRLFLNRGKTCCPLDMNGANLHTPHAAKVLLSADELQFLCDLLQGEKHLAEYRAGLSETTSARASATNRSVVNEALLNKLNSYLRNMR